MTSNWPYHGPVIYLFIQQIFTKSLLLVGPHPALGRGACSEQCGPIASSLPFCGRG